MFGIWAYYFHSFELTCKNAQVFQICKHVVQQSRLLSSRYQDVFPIVVTCLEQVSTLLTDLLQVVPARLIQQVATSLMLPTTCHVQTISDLMEQLVQLGTSSVIFASSKYTIIPIFVQCYTTMCKANVYVHISHRHYHELV